MEDKRPEVRQAAAQALWDLKAPHEKVGPALAAALNDDDPDRGVARARRPGLAGRKNRSARLGGSKIRSGGPSALALVQRMGPQAKQCVPTLIKLLGEKGDDMVESADGAGRDWARCRRGDRPDYRITRAQRRPG